MARPIRFITFYFCIWCSFQKNTIEGKNLWKKTAVKLLCHFISLPLIAVTKTLSLQKQFRLKSHPIWAQKFISIHKITSLVRIRVFISGDLDFFMYKTSQNYICSKYVVQQNQTPLPISLLKSIFLSFFLLSWNEEI